MSDSMFFQYSGVTDYKPSRWITINYRDGTTERHHAASSCCWWTYSGLLRRFTLTDGSMIMLELSAVKNIIEETT
jgi:hypothetical protein